MKPDPNHKHIFKIYSLSYSRFINNWKLRVAQAIHDQMMAEARRAGFTGAALQQLSFLIRTDMTIFSGILERRRRGESLEIIMGWLIVHLSGASNI